jgi:polyhydroxyalkanoate synthesis regulator phasin
MHEPPVRPGDVAPYVEDERPATLADVRGLRRWLAVTAVWAVAATALGVFALIEANRAKDDSGARTEAAGELGRVQRALNGRIDDLESRVDQLPSTDDLTKLDSRIKDLEKTADKTATDTERLSGRVDDLETRVDQLEQANQDQGTTTTP